MPISEVKLIDCIEYMKTMPDKFFDLAVVDPPYGIGAGGLKFKNRTSKSKKEYFKTIDWDNNIPSLEYFKELIRVSKNQVIWGGNYFSHLLPAFRCFIVWDKTIHGNSYADCELAWTSFDKVARYFRENIVQSTKEGRIHPTQKSIRLYRFVFNEFCEKGYKILDTHLGSGSSRIAAWQMGFDFYGCEIDEKYFADSCKRFDLVSSQQTMF